MRITVSSRKPLEISNEEMILLQPCNNKIMGINSINFFTKTVCFSGISGKLLTCHEISEVTTLEYLFYFQNLDIYDISEIYKDIF